MTYITAPPGSLNMYAGATAPSGWLICDGSAVSRTTYADLFAAIGTAYGVGDGSLTFNLPDFLGRVAVGKGTNADVNALGNSDGLAVGSRSPKHNSTNGLTLPNHTHNATVNDPGHYHTTGVGKTGGDGASAPQGGIGATLTANWNSDSKATGITVSISNPNINPAISGSIGPGGSRPNDQVAHLVVNYIIKY